MARAKKEAALTPEERLQAALVPDWEWPYKLPENWCWVRLYSLAHIISKGTTPKGGKDAYVEKGIRFLRIENINEDGSISHENIKHITEEMHTGFLRRSILCKDDILISIAGTLGKTGIVGEADLPLNTNQAISFVRLIRGNLLPQYIKMSIDNPKTQDMLISQTKVTSIPNLTLEIIENCAIPLAPLAEQQRIVDRIESLFAKLDEAKEKAQAVLDSFETRKAAILHKAFTGELTAKWREEHGVRMESCEVRTLDSVCSSIFDGDHMPPPKAESGIPFLVISNVNTGHLTFENTRFVPQEYYDTLSDTRKPQLGDVLYTLVGSFGIPVVVNSKRPFCFQRHMALLRPIDVSPQFLWYILQTPEMYDKASSIATGTAQLTVPIKGLRAMTIPRPKIAEQVEIVRILDGFFAREQSAKEAAEAVLDQIDLMKKSILARAFRGELGTNDPSEESAVELLKEIIRRG